MDRNSDEGIPKFAKIHSLPEEINGFSNNGGFRDLNVTKIENNHHEIIEKKVIQKEKQIINENMGNKLGMLSIHR